MILTGKCNKDFEEWLCENVNLTEISKVTKENVIKDVSLTFELYSFSMQYGVLVDFFDSVNIYIEITTIETLIERFFDLSIEHNNTCDDIKVFEFKTRKEAREQAILKANEIYNKR